MYGQLSESFYNFSFPAVRPDFSLSGELPIPLPWVGTGQVEAPPARDPLKRGGVLRREELDFLLDAREVSSAAHLSVLNEEATIISVNQAWRDFARANDMQDPAHGVGTNYLQICDQARGSGAYEAQVVAQGIRDVLEGRYVRFLFNYPCHAPRARQWFSVRITRHIDNGRIRLVVAHEPRG